MTHSSYLVHLSLSGAESSSSLLVQMSEVDEKAKEHEDQVELQSIGETEGVAQSFGEGNAVEERLIKDRQRLDNSYSLC